MPRKRVILQLGKEIPPWERQEGESPTSYSRLTVYISLGRSRKITKLYEKLTADGETIALSSLYSDSHYGRWTERACMFDIDQLQQRQHTIADNHAGIGGLLLKRAVDALNNIDPETLNPMAIVRMINLGTNLQVRAVGLPQQTVAISNTSGGPVEIDYLSGLTPSERRARLAEIVAELSARSDYGDDDSNGENLYDESELDDDMG